MADETRNELGAWARDCGGYFMRFEQGDGGKLVRLDRVRRWLMAGDDGLPYEPAGEALLAPLEALTHAEIGQWLYLANEGQQARLVSGSDNFMWSMLAFLDHEDAPDPADCGVRGALTNAREHWCKGPADKMWWGNDEALAVPVAKAHELWGWGVVQAPAVAAISDSWTPERIAKRHAELTAQGVKNATQVVAREAGIGGKDPTRMVRHYLRQHSAAQRPSPLPSVSNVRRIRQR